MIKGVGIDISKVERFNALKDKNAFIHEVLTPGEITAVGSGPDTTGSLALLFSIKEAFIKALRCGLHLGHFWRQINIDPRLEVDASGRIRDLINEKSISKLHISAARTKKNAVGIVVMESEDQFQEVL
ncbi:MAG: 4'-phosphopantetheinyl transferase superfamily protein [candidate division WOR-3 bacterium]|nr:MAG: 4'-phosphopantetheinyl transferase superfamily protein [candidate division WOR-3 bacterium]